MKSKIPLYDTLNIKLRGYDFSVLEEYQKLVHSLVKNMDINMEETWPVPAQKWDITTYKSNSELIASQYQLQLYQRVVQITDITSLQVIFLKYFWISKFSKVARIYYLTYILLPILIYDMFIIFVLHFRSIQFDRSDSQVSKI